MNNEHPAWIDWCIRMWTSLLALAYHIVAELADKLINIAAKSLPIAAPLPNAISVYHLSQAIMGYEVPQALAFAVTLELFLFAVVEISLIQWDGYLRDRSRYTAPLYTMIGVTALSLLIVVTIVYNVEISNGGHHVMALLPFISICAFVAIGLKRLDESWKAEGITRAKRPAKKRGNIADPTRESEKSSVEIMNEAKQRKIASRREEISRIVYGNFPISTSEISKMLSTPVSTRTVANDLNEIADALEIENVAGKWQPVRKAIPFSANGATHESEAT